MNIDQILLIIQLVFLAIALTAGLLGLKVKNLFNPWYMRIMWTFVVLNWVCFILILVF